MYNVDYTFYTGTYFGTLIPSENAFKSVLVKAEAKVTAYTHNKVDLENIPTAVKNAVCAVAETYYKMQQQEENNGKTVVSESVGNHSRSFQQSKQKTLEEFEADMDADLNTILYGTGLNYRGLKICTHI